VRRSGTPLPLRAGRPHHSVAVSRASPLMINTPIRERRFRKFVSIPLLAAALNAVILSEAKDLCSCPWIDKRRNQLQRSFASLRMTAVIVSHPLAFALDGYARSCRSIQSL
jgi:hypothetical protein